MSKKLTAYGKIKDGTLELSYLDKFWTAVRTLPDGRYRLVLEKIYNKRSNQQNAYLWALVYPLIRDGLIEIGYDEFAQDTDCEMTHDLCKLRFLEKELVNKDTGEVIQSLGSTRKLTTTKFMEYVANLQKWASEYLGINIPDPDPLYKTVKQL